MRCSLLLVLMLVLAHTETLETRNKRLTPCTCQLMRVSRPCQTCRP